jgi:hypothetical protein
MPEIQIPRSKRGKMSTPSPRDFDKRIRPVRVTFSVFDPPPMPTPDGSLIIRTVHGQEHTYAYADMPHHWRPTSSGLKVSKPGGWITYCWHQVFSYESVTNSPEFGRAMERYNVWAETQVTKKEDESCDG